VVLGHDAQARAVRRENALGAKVRIGGLQFRVIGVLESKGSHRHRSRRHRFIPAARALELFTATA